MGSRATRGRCHLHEARIQHISLQKLVICLVPLSAVIYIAQAFA